MRMRGYGGAVAAVLAALVSSHAEAAQIEFRPDLVERVLALKPVYPVQSGSSIAAAPSPTTEELADPGELATIDSGQPHNVLLVSGVIEKGDAARLEEMLTSTFQISVAFDRPGGSFSEGFAIGEKIVFNLGSSDPTVRGVYVLDGMQCMSACAVAFSMAQESRFVEGGAKLGFHMPYLPEDKAGQQGAAGELLDLAYDITGAFNRLLEAGINPPKLLSSMLSHRTADSFFVLDGGIETWNYGFTPVEAGRWTERVYVYGMDFDMAGALCNNIFLYGRAFRQPYEEEYGMFGEREDLDIPLLTEFMKQTGKRSFARSGAGGFSCEIRVYADDTVGIAVWRGTRVCTDNSAQPGETEKWCPVAPNDTFPVTLGMLADVLGCTGGAFDARAALNGFYAKRDVNVRRAPSLEAEVFGTMRKNDRPPVIGCEITRDNQAIWYRLKGQGSDGYVSARYVGGQGNIYRFFEQQQAAQ